MSEINVRALGCVWWVLQKDGGTMRVIRVWRGPHCSQRLGPRPCQPPLPLTRPRCPGRVGQAGDVNAPEHPFAEGSREKKKRIRRQSC